MKVIFWDLYHQKDTLEMIYIKVLLVFHTNLVPAGNVGVITPEAESLFQSAEQEKYRMRKKLSLLPLPTASVLF